MTTTAPTRGPWELRYLRRELPWCSACFRRRGFEITRADEHGVDVVTALCGPCRLRAPEFRPLTIADAKADLGAAYVGVPVHGWRSTRPVLITFTCVACRTRYQGVPPYVAHVLTEGDRPIGLRCEWCWAYGHWPIVEPDIVVDVPLRLHRERDAE